MNTSTFFSLQRLVLVLKRYMAINQKGMWVGLGMGGVLIVVSLINTYINNGVYTNDPFINTGMTLFFIGGYIFASTIFNELHTPSRGQFYLTLPASNLEKLTAAWLISAPMFVLVAFIALMFFSLVASSLGALFFGSQLGIFNPFTATHFHSAGVFLVTHSIFFLGAIYFRKLNFLKTILALFIVMMAISLWGVILGYLFFGTAGLQFGESTTLGSPSFFTEFLPQMSKIVFWGVVGPFFLIVSYFRFKEREV